MDKKKSKNPFVSIYVPVYNAHETIGRAIASILKQTYDNYEIVVVDNASTDDTCKIIREFNDPRVVIQVNEINIGAEKNWEKCVELASGEYTAVFHADDIYEPDIIENEVNAFADNPSLLGIFTLATFINDLDEVIGKSVLPLRLRGKKVYDYSDILLAVLDSPLKNANPFMTPAVLVRTETYKKIMPLRRGEIRTATDFDLWLRLSKIGPVTILSERLLNYRMSSEHIIYKQDCSRTYEEGIFKVLDDHIANKPAELIIPKEVLERYEIRRNIDRLKSSVNCLSMRDYDSVKGLLENFPKWSFLWPILKNIKQPVLLAYWGAGNVILLTAYAGLGKQLGKGLQWYLHVWRRRWFK